MWILILSIGLLMLGMRMGGWVYARNQRLNARIEFRREAATHEPEPIVNTRTGEVLDPGTRRFNRVIAQSKVHFKED